MPRLDGRLPNQIRDIKIIKSPQRDPTGSVLIKWGNSHIICAVHIDEKLPPWMSGENSGWITAEYGMLPGCSDKRIHREKIRTTGRTHEIQRLIGRSIRACMDLKDLGPRTVTIDCDVIQADGGTRVASITGGYLAFRLALAKMAEKRNLSKIPQTTLVSALSLGKVNGELMLDLNYPEDVKAEVDANIVMNEKGEFIEIQGTAEKGTFKQNEFDQMLTLAREGFEKVFEIQRSFLKEHSL